MTIENIKYNFINNPKKQMTMKKYFLFAAVALMAASCITDENENANVQNDNAIRLTSSLPGAVTRATNGLLEGNSATTSEQNFANTTPVKVKVTDTNASPITYEPVDYTADGSGGLTATPAQYYPASGSAVNIYAYYPSTASTDTDGFAVLLDQGSAASGDNNYKASDLMYATLSGITKSSTDEQRTLTFNHKLSKIIVTLAKGTGMTDGEINAATVTLKDVVYKGTFTPADGSFTAASADVAANKGDIVIAENASTTAHAAIVVPQDVAGKKIAVTINGATQEYTIPASTTFATGTYNSYTITVAKSGLTVTSTIGNWNEGSSGSDTLTY